MLDTLKLAQCSVPFFDQSLKLGLVSPLDFSGCQLSTSSLQICFAIQRS